MNLIYQNFPPDQLAIRGRYVIAASGPMEDIHFLGFSFSNEGGQIGDSNLKWPANLMQTSAKHRLSNPILYENSKEDQSPDWGG